MKQIRLIFLCVIFTTCPAILFANQDPNPFFEKRSEGVCYPAGFQKGVASSTYQNGGHRFWKSLGYRPESNWSWFENEFKTRFLVGREREGGPSLTLPESSPIDRGEKVSLSADIWEQMFDDIKLIKALGCNSHRFEIPWTDLNPKEGVWNEEAFAFFDRYIDELLKNGIEPMVTIYHWVHPKWFHDKGAWEKQENISYFLAYCKELFRRFGPKVKYWCTINEPTVVSCSGYIMGNHAPGKKDPAATVRPFFKNCMLSLLPHNYDLAGVVLGNLLKAHVEAYTVLKGMPGGKEANIGIVHQLTTFEAAQKEGIASLLNPLNNRIAEQFNKNFAHKTVMLFFSLGLFSYQLPDGNYVRFVDLRAPQSNDFIGLNFYSNVLLGPVPEVRNNEIALDMDFWAMRPHLMYSAIKEMSQFGKPIMITENGICDSKDDRREQWIVSYSNAVKKALDDGYDVRGYYYWSLVDNFEWNMGHKQKFGLYEVETKSNDPSKKMRVLRKGAKAYRDYVRVALR